MKKITYGFIALVTFLLLISSCQKQSKTEIGSNTINIGALLSLTGNWSSLGITSQAAIDIALEDINTYMNQTGSRNRFAAIIYDTKLDTELASQHIASAAARGCQFVLGPQSSAEAGAVKGYADANDILVVSQGSTAGSLSIEGDNLFRFCPDDHIEGAAMAKTIHNDGIKSLVTVARDDAGNKGLQLSTRNAFKALGGNVTDLTPYGSTTTNFAALIADIKAKIDQYKTTNATTEIAVYLASFDECVPLFQLAASDPTLSSVRWYGGDGTALSAALTSNPTAANFAISTKYFAPAFGLPAQAASKWQPLSEKIKAKTGIAPDAFALATYDALWVIALSYNSTSSLTPEVAKLKAEFAAQANHYNGATGTTILNEAGDRGVGSYDYWGIEREGNSYKWVVVGKSK